MDEYNRALQNWCSVEDESKHEFTITEKDILEEKQKKLKRKTESTKRLSQSEGDLKKFAALPPIGSGKSRARSGRENPKDRGCAQPAPVPPKPFLLHFSVSAQTLETGDVRFDRDVLALSSSIMRWVHEAWRDALANIKQHTSRGV